MTEKPRTALKYFIINGFSGSQDITGAGTEEFLKCEDHSK